MTLLLLTACFSGENSVRVRGNAPFKLGKAEAAYWAEDADDAYGYGRLILAGKPLACDEVVEEDFIWRDDTPLWDTWAVIADFRYYASSWDTAGDGVVVGWEGVYAGGTWNRAERKQDTLISRSLGVMVYADGQAFDLDAWPSLAEITDHGGTVEGKLDHELLGGRFAAESCGRLQYGGGDSW